MKLRLTAWQRLVPTHRATPECWRHAPSTLNRRLSLSAPRELSLPNNDKMPTDCCISSQTSGILLCLSCLMQSSKKPFRYPFIYPISCICKLTRQVVAPVCLSHSSIHCIFKLTHQGQYQCDKHCYLRYKGRHGKVMSFRMSTRVTAIVVCCILTQIFYVVSQKKLQLLGGLRASDSLLGLRPWTPLGSPDPHFYVPQ